eukprot:3943322-Karenia_brevis.AAC.1
MARYRRDGSSKKCICGAKEATVEHVTWSCPRYEKERAALLNSLPKPLKLERCTMYAGIIPFNCSLTRDQVVGLHEFMVNVWRDQVRIYYKAVDVVEQFGDEVSQGTAVLNENGHHLEKRKDNDGVWCRKCG